MVLGASVKQFSSGIPHSREFWAMAMRRLLMPPRRAAGQVVVQGADQVKGKGLGLAGHEPTLARVQPMTPLRVILTA